MARRAFAVAMACALGMLAYADWGAPPAGLCSEGARQAGASAR